jgi:hypothetical protein
MSPATGQDLRIGRRLYRAGTRDNAVLVVPVPLDQSFADPLRRAGDDCNFLLRTHDGPP